jgi:hypothetical protein
LELCYSSFRKRPRSCHRCAAALRQLRVCYCPLLSRTETLLLERTLLLGPQPVTLMHSLGDDKGGGEE